MMPVQYVVQQGTQNQVPVKNTFVHFDAAPLTANNFMRSAPPAMLQQLDPFMQMPAEIPSSPVSTVRSMEMLRAAPASNQMPVKNTFIHFDAWSADGKPTNAADGLGAIEIMKSAPPAMFQLDPFAETEIQQTPAKISSSESSQRAAHASKLLLQEALTFDLCEDVLTRLQPGGSDKMFSTSVIVALRNQFGITLVKELCCLEGDHISQLQGVNDDEKWRLEQLCESMRKELPFFSSQQERNEMPIKNTFIHFDTKTTDLVDDADLLTVAGMMKSAPPAMLQRSFHTNAKWPEMEARHLAGNCRPCAYFYKDETCRWGGQCAFCHLCPKGEIKVRKKEKVKALRAKDRASTDTSSPGSRTSYQSSATGTPMFKGSQPQIIAGSRAPLQVQSPPYVVLPQGQPGSQYQPQFEPGTQYSSSASTLPNPNRVSNRMINLFSLT